jgi:hypothetical protein
MSTLTGRADQERIDRQRRSMTLGGHAGPPIPVFKIGLFDTDQRNPSSARALITGSTTECWRGGNPFRPHSQNDEHSGNHPRS